MPTFTEALEPTKSHKHRGIRWTPCDPGSRCPCSGALVVQRKGAADLYRVTEFPVGAGFTGRAFELEKAADGTRYAVRVGERVADVDCDCAGFTYGGGKRTCKHIDAVRAILENGWMPNPLCNGEQDR